MRKFTVTIWRNVALTIGGMFYWLSSLRSFGSDDQAVTVTIDGLKYKVLKEVPESIPKELTILKKDGEILNRRTENSREYYLGNGKYRTESYLAPVFYKDEKGEFKDIDPVLAKGRLEGTAYKASLLAGEYGYTIKRREDEGGFTFKLKSIGGVKPEYKEPKYEKNKAVWEEIVPGVDLTIAFEPYAARVWRKLHTAQAPHNIVWDVQEYVGSKKVRLIEAIEGKDSEEKPLFSRRTTRQEIVEGQYKHYEIEDEFTGEVIEMAKDTRRKRLEMASVYPLETTQWAAAAAVEAGVKYPAMIDADISAVPPGGFDAGFGALTTYQTLPAPCGGFNSLGGLSSPIKNTNFATGPDSYHAQFYRFPGITIRQSSTIDYARLRIQQRTASTGAGTIQFRAKKLNDPAIPANAAQVCTPGTLATAVLNVTFTDPAVNTIRHYNVTAIVQELVNAFDYSNEHMLFFLRKTANTAVAGFPVVVGGLSAVPANIYPRLQIDFTSFPLNGAIIVVE